MKRALRLFWVLLLSLSLFAGVRTSHAQDVTLNFREAELLAVLEFYSRLTGKVFVPAEQISGKVTVISPRPLSEEQAVKMLFSILDMRGYAVVEIDDYYKIVQKSAALESAVGMRSNGDAGDRLVTEFFAPDHVNVNDLLESVRALVSTQGRVVGDPTLNFLTVTDVASNLERVNALVRRVDRPVPVNRMFSRSHRLQYAQTDDMLPLVSSLLQGQSSQPTPPGVDASVQGLQPPTAFGPTGASTPSATVIADSRTNTLIVTATADQHQQVQVLIDELDSRSPQVLLEATIVEVILNDSSKLGVQWQFLTNRNPLTSFSQATQDSAGLLSDSASLSTASGLSVGLLSPGDYATLINLLASDNSATVLSAPHLMASNNKEANLRVGDEIPFLKEFRLDADNNPIRTFERQQVGLNLKFTPSIAENRDVSMALGITISSVRPGGTTDNNEFTTSEREINTNVVVKDRQTLVISGLMRDNVTDNSAGIPGLRKTAVGPLFGNQESNAEKGELLILIRPHVITSEDEAKLAGDLQLRQHPEAAKAGAIRPAGIEFDL